MSRRGALVYLALAALIAGAYFLSTRYADRRAARESLSRRVFDIQPSAVTAIELARAGEPEVRIERAGPPATGTAGEAATKRPAWRITAPLQVAADPDAVHTVIDAAVKAEKRRTLEGKDLNPAEYGLDHPTLRVSLEAAGATHTLEFGVDTVSGDARYARVADGKSVFLLPAASYNQMDLGLAGLRDRRLLPLDRSALQRVTVQWPDGRVGLVRKNGRWRFAKSSRPVSDTAVDGLIATVSDTNVDRFVTDEGVPLADYHLDEPDAMVTFEGGGQSWVTRFKKQGKDAKPPAVLAARSTAPGIVALPATFLDRLPRSSADLEDLILFRGDADAVRAVTLHAGKKEARFVKEGNDWKLADTSPKGKEKGGSPDVPALLSLLADLRHEGPPPSGTTAPGRFELSLELADAKGEPLLDLEIAPALEDNGDHVGRLADSAGERGILLSRFTVENLYDNLRLMAPGLPPGAAKGKADTPPTAAPAAQGAP